EALGPDAGSRRRSEGKMGSGRRRRCCRHEPAELVRLNVDVVVTGGTPAAKALKSATRTIPIILAIVGDPVAAGLVDNLARPGGNATGFSIVAPELGPKRLELLKEIAPKVSSVAVLLNTNNPQSKVELKEMQTAAQAIGLQLHP